MLHELKMVPEVPDSVYRAIAGGICTVLADRRPACAGHVAFHDLSLQRSLVAFGGERVIVVRLSKGEHENMSVLECIHLDS